MARSNTVMLAAFCEELEQDILPSVEHITTILSRGDTILLELGDAGYAAIDAIEPITTGVALTCHDPLNSDGTFEKNMIAATIDDLDECAATGSRDLHSSLVNGLADAIRGTQKHRFEIYSEIHGMNRLWGYPRLDVAAGFAKCRGKMREEPELSEDYNEISVALRGMLIQCICVNYFNAHNRLLPIRNQDGLTDRQLRSWFKRGRIPKGLVNTGALPQPERWSDIIFDGFLPLEPEADISFLKDKTIGVPLSECSTLFKGLQTRHKVRSKHSHMLLLATANAAVDTAATIRQFSRKGRY